MPWVQGILCFVAILMLYFMNVIVVVDDAQSPAIYAGDAAVVTFSSCSTLNLSIGSFRAYVAVLSFCCSTFGSADSAM